MVIFWIEFEKKGKLVWVYQGFFLDTLGINIWDVLKWEKSLKSYTIRY